MAKDAVLIEANKMFYARQFSNAVWKYGVYIKQLLVHKTIDDARLVIGYANRAAAWLQLKKFKEALNDAESALQVDIHHAKSLLRKAQAYEGLGFFQEARSAYHTLLRIDGLNPTALISIVESLTKVEIKDKQTEGDYEGDNGLLLSIRQSSLDQEVEDFVGPVELRKSPTMGRGLFATRDVQKGELLLVSNPLLPIRFHGGEGGYEEAKLKAITMLKEGLQKIRKDSFDNPQDFRRLQLLVQTDMLSGPCPEDPVRDVPSMRYFKPVNSLTPADKLVSLSDWNHPCIAAALYEERLVNPNWKLHQNNSEGVYMGSIYVLPALINHSCLPNVTITMIALKNFPQVVRASRGVRRGEEFFFPYNDIFCPLDERREPIEGVYCRCRRCVSEERMLDQFSALRELQTKCRSLWDQRGLLPLFSSSAQAMFWNQCIEAINSVNSFFSVLPEHATMTIRERAWMRSSFVRFYVLVLLNPIGRSIRNTAARDFVLDFERNLIYNAVIDMTYVDPASLLALCMCVERVKYPSLLEYGEVDILLPSALQFLTVNFGTSKDQGLAICASGCLEGRLTEFDT